LSLVIFTTLVQISPAEVPYRLIWDKNFSPYTGAHNIITLHKGIYEIENSLLKTKWFEENNFVNKSAGIVYRLGKSLLLENVIDHMSFLTQHEIFGHGARFREFGFKNNQFSLHFIFPYGDAQGRAETGELPSQRALSDHEHLVMITGGSSSNALLSRRLKYHWLSRKSINFRETILYLISSNDLSFYILRTQWDLKGPCHNDVLNYLTAINTQHGYYGEENYRLTLDQLSRQALIHTLDPFQYFSLFTYFVNYLWSGKERFEIPLIPVFGLRYLPSFYLGLSPFGSEFYFENYFLYKEKIFSLFIRIGDPTFHKSWGIGMEAINLIKQNNLSLNSQFHIWNQPSLLLGGEKITKGNSGLGGSFLITAFYEFTNSPLPISLVGEIGYKTSGYVQGETLSQGVIARAGLALHLNKKNMK